MRSGAAQTAVPLIRGSKRKGEASRGAPTCSGRATASWKATRTGLSREIVPLVKAATTDFSASVSSPRSRGFFARVHAAAAATRHSTAVRTRHWRRIPHPLPEGLRPGRRSPGPHGILRPSVPRLGGAAA